MGAAQPAARRTARPAAPRPQAPARRKLQVVRAPRRRASFRGRIVFVMVVAALVGFITVGLAQLRVTTRLGVVEVHRREVQATVALLTDRLERSNDSVALRAKRGLGLVDGTTSAPERIRVP